ncbi:MBL fold metallo-hydrolase [Sphingomonas dokdonensis]|uniref:Metal-dependent hydrolase n=1 Tax=Sphingomonas dokdonensis TaxID=344880 RepID=A0A245ZMZ4_9SPHN|nr:MBL fold metallo-hydrolase [Sphingomonas dokdonensis]OWK31115.1 metal-dependent hydrolase [Sphingomonas dokdonensis]
MRRVLKLAATALLLLTVVAGLAATIVPRFLDRIYYRGPATDHFNGSRFFNPDGEDDTARPPTGGSRAGFLWRFLSGSDGRPPWPDKVTVKPSVPERRVMGDRMVATWIGHATVLVQTQGLNILTDPIWSDRAGPLGFGPTRVTAPGVRFDDLPKIDLVLVSHNHYDHLDQETLKRLWQRDRPLVVTSLGNDSVIGQVGVPARAVDWGQSVVVRPGVEVIVSRNHHWGSRWFADRNRALWSAFTIRLPGGNLFFAGDTGLGDGQWPAEAASHGPVRLALIPIGAFRFVPAQMASGSHIGPPDAVRVFSRMAPSRAVPIHWGTFRLSYEARDTPPRMLSAVMRCAGFDPARFAPVGLGRPLTVPPVGSQPPRGDESRIEKCLSSAPVAALQ